MSEGKALKLKLLFALLAIAVTFTCFVLQSEMYRMNYMYGYTSFNITPLEQLHRYLFFNETSNSSSHLYRGDKRYSILLFNPPSWFDVKYYSKSLSKWCVYDNCRLTVDTNNLRNNSAIVFVLTAAPALPAKPPLSLLNRSHNQVWIFAWLESPVHHGKNVYQNKYWRNTVNWTMTYTYDADVFFPYGNIRKRTPPAKDYSEIFKRKNKMAAWVVSNCHTQSKREEFVNKLRQYGVKVDMFGGCAGNRIKSDEILEKIDQNYKFYLSFENSFCKDYITEKFFLYFKYNVLLVARGAGNYSRLLPTDSYINTADFGSVKDLAKHILYIGSSEERYTRYMKNKDRYESVDQSIRNESFCKICEKLNNLEHNKRTYTDLVDRVTKGTCFKPTDIR